MIEKCENCGATIDTSDKFCGDCGVSAKQAPGNKNSFSKSQSSDARIPKVQQATGAPSVRDEQFFSLLAALGFFVLFSFLLLSVLGFIQYFYIYSEKVRIFMQLFEDSTRNSGMSNYQLFIDPVLVGLIAVISLYLVILVAKVHLSKVGLIVIFGMTLAFRFAFNMFEFHIPGVTASWPVSFIDLSFYGGSFFTIYYSELVFSFIVTAGLAVLFKTTAIRKVVSGN